MRGQHGTLQLNKYKEDKDMANKFKSFDGIGVEVYIGSQIQSTSYFTSMKKAAEYFMLKQSQGFRCRFITVDEHGITIEDIT